MIAWLGGPVVVEAARVVVLLGAGLLLPAGVAKLRRPDAAAEALGWRTSARSRLVLRSVGAGELALAALVFLVGGLVPLLGLAGAYAGFTVVAARQRARGAACACFGAADAPTGWTHVVLNPVVAVTAVTLAAAAQPVSAGPLLDPTAGWTAWLSAVLLVVAVAGLQQVLTALPDLRAATRRVTLPAPRTIESRPTGANP